MKLIVGPRTHDLESRIENLGRKNQGLVLEIYDQGLGSILHIFGTFLRHIKINIRFNFQMESLLF